MIKLYLKRIFSIISLSFCTMSIASAWDVDIANGLIKFETEKNVDIRQGKRGSIKVRLKSIDGSIISAILRDFDFKSSDKNNLIFINEDFYIDIYENRRPNIVFYEYFRVNNVNYQLELYDDGNCEKDLDEKGIDVYLNDNNDDFSNNKQTNCYDNYEYNNFN